MTCEFNCFKPLIPLYSDMARFVYEGDGSTTDYQFNFDYIGRGEFSGTKSRYIRVYVGSNKDSVAENTDFTMPTAGSVRISPAPANGTFILIMRDSRPNETMVDFQNEGVLSEADLDLAYQHNLKLIQELFDKLHDISCRLDELCGVSNAGNGGPQYSFVGNCSDTEYILDDDDGPYGQQTDLGEEDILVFINGILQPTQAYQINNESGTSTVVFDTPPTNSDNIYIKVISNARIAYQVQGTGIADGAVTTAKLADGAVTPAKMGFNGNGSIRQVYQNTDGTNWNIATLTAAAISNFDTQVRTSRLNQMTAPNAAVSMNSQKITNLADGTDSSDAANYGQVTAMTTQLTTLQNRVAGGYNQDFAGIMPDIYFRASYQTARYDAWNFYNGVVPAVATTNRSASERLLIGFVPRRMKILIAGQLRRNNNSNIVYSHTNITRVFEFDRWDDDNWFTVPASTPLVTNHKSYTLTPRSASTGDVLTVTNMTFTVEIDFQNYRTWFYITGSGYGSELMRLVNPNDTNAPGVVQIIAERGY